jgi:hypothetical protein
MGSTQQRNTIKISEVNLNLRKGEVTDTSVSATRCLMNRTRSGVYLTPGNVSIESVSLHYIFITRWKYQRTVFSQRGSVWNSGYKEVQRCVLMFFVGPNDTPVHKTRVSSPQ